MSLVIKTAAFLRAPGWDQREGTAGAAGQGALAASPAASPARTRSRVLGSQTPRQLPRGLCAQDKCFLSSR